MIDRLCDLSPVGKIELRAGWLRHRVRANWKIAAENVCDFYHPPITHASSGLTTGLPAGFFSDSSGGVTRDLGNGHGEVDYRPSLVGSAPRPLEEHQGLKRRHLDLLAARDGAAGAVARLRAGPPHGFIFPNLFIAEQNIFVIQPISVGELSHMQTAISWVGLPDEVNRRHLRRFEGGFGPAGMVEPDDSAVWERLQVGLEAGEPEWAILERGSDRDTSGEGRLLDETALRGFWRHYRFLMTAGVAAR
jgi:fatty-acyl-CoA synthase